jgi:hypothetical protein
VLSRQGQPALLGGVEVACLNDGVTVTTDADGTFTLDVPGGVVVRVRFTDPLDPGTALPDLPPCGERDDGTPDDGDLEDDVVEILPLADGEVCVLEVELAGGRVIECALDLPGHADGGPPPFFRGEGVLVPLDAAHLCAAGEVEVEVEGDCAALELEAAGLAPGAAYAVVLVAPDLAEEPLGALVADADGAAHLRVEGCAGDALPFGVDSLADLAGYAVIVLDADGLPVLAGQVPGRGHEHGEPGHDGGHDGNGLPPGLPPLPGPFPDPGDLPPVPDYEDVLDLLDDLLGGNDFGFPGFGG